MGDSNEVAPKTIEEKVKIHRINNNIDLISGFLRLDEYEKHMSTTDGKDMQLYMWLDDYYEEYNIGQYDYIIIDTKYNWNKIK